ncbi:OB-fold protein [Loigolactobacillus iwatensis]|uniref:OB-fold protein n=1 Tax=Loigolactobacillus iwatensis TaxID=1267156 RepID=UPI000F7F8BC3
MSQKINAETLYESYEGLHNSTYDNQMVTVTGTVTYVGPDSYGLPSIEIGNPNDGKAWVICVVSDFAGAQSGNQIEITGHAEGFTQGVVVLKHCTVDEVSD